jgi:Putative adhesin
MTMRLILPLALLFATLAHAEEVQRSLEADPKGEVQITNVAGQVHVLGWDRNEVQVQGELGPNVARLDFRRDGRLTLVRVVLEEGRHSGADTDLQIHIPRESAVTLNTVSADQTIEQVRGFQKLQAVSGSINTQIWTGECEATTVSGEVSIKANDAGAPLRVNTVSGGVRLIGGTRELDLSTVSGELEVRVAELGRARIKTTNGSLDLASKLARDARVEAEAINGEMRLVFEGAIDADFDIETFNGEIDNCFGPKAQRAHQYGPGNELRFREGSGSASVRVKTLNGEVQLCKR